MSRRHVSSRRRFGDAGRFPFTVFSHSKSPSPPCLSLALILLGLVLLVFFAFGGFGSRVIAVSKIKGDYSCTAEVQRTMPFLKKAYGHSMRKVLHVGPDTCSVVSMLLKEEGTEAWGVEPYDIEDADASCKSLVREGIVRVADLKFPLALQGEVIFSWFPWSVRAKVVELSKFGRPAETKSSSWWMRYFVQTSLEENEDALKKFEQAATKRSYKPTCQVFHLNPYR